MLKAGSLFYATTIALIIAILTSSLIYYAYINRLQFNNYEMLETVARNASSGMQLLLSDLKTVSWDEVKEVDLFGKGTDSVSLQRKAWGVYELDICKAHAKHLQYQKMALTGFGIVKGNMPGLYLADNDRPLALCGSTVIKGTSFIPKAGVKRAYIEGQSYNGIQLLYGAIRESKRELPPLNKELIQQLERYFKYQPAGTDSVIFPEQLRRLDTLQNSFSKPTIVVHNNGPLHLSEKRIHGNVIIISDTLILVEKSADLQQILLIAPTIKVASGFIGNVQLFASDSVVLKKESKLLFPSVVGLFRQKKSPKSIFVEIEEEAVVEGTVVAYEEKKDFTQFASIKMEKKAMVRGLVYSSSFADIKGTIQGTLICDKIILVSPSAVYENHLLNVVIDPTILSPHYVSSRLEEQKGSRKIAQWVY